MSLDAGRPSSASGGGSTGGSGGGASSGLAGGPGEIDYRLERSRVLAEYRSGDLDRNQVCDAQPELQRNAEFCGEPTGRDCPVCDVTELVHVTYVFGPRMPAHGRCVTTKAEMARLRSKNGNFTGYVVEVCTSCHWNHLAKTYLLTPIQAD